MGRAGIVLGLNARAWPENNAGLGPPARDLRLSGTLIATRTASTTRPDFNDRMLLA